VTVFRRIAAFGVSGTVHAADLLRLTATCRSSSNSTVTEAAMKLLHDLVPAMKLLHDLVPVGHMIHWRASCGDLSQERPPD